MDLKKYLEIEQFSLNKGKKKDLLMEQLIELHRFHMQSSEPYRKISKIIFKVDGEPASVEKLPFLPVSLFKTNELKSISDEEIYKVLTSSGTTGSVPSRIYLDAETARLQTTALAKIMTHVLGKDRLPMMIVDSRQVFKNRASFSARGAGVLGMSVFGKDHHYVLDERFELDSNKLAEFLDKYNGKRMLIFGFTFMIWKYLYLSEFPGEIDLSKAVLIHSGGWKKLLDLAVDNETFKNKLQEKFGLQRVYNFYGMVEQVGSVFIENSQGFLQCPNFSDIIIRDPEDFAVQQHGKEGLVQVVSVLPKSYPGHSILTEDVGVCMGEDDAENGWKGKYFKILGRASKTELRGCSDTFAAEMETV